MFLRDSIKDTYLFFEHKLRQSGHFMITNYSEYILQHTHTQLCTYTITIQDIEHLIEVITDMLEEEHDEYPIS
jgi:hypothetical protein